MALRGSIIDSALLGIELNKMDCILSLEIVAFDLL
jgi:hypothetical protein